MDTQNHFYGHSAVLAASAGQRRVRHVSGLIQHGWVASSPLAVNFGDFPDVGRPGDHRALVVWSHSSRAWSPADETRSTVAIGAPLLYLTRLRPSASAAPPGARPLIMPLHRTHVRRVASDPPSLAAFYREALGEAVVCLHAEDLKQEGVVRAWRSHGHDVVTAGDRFDPRFLTRLVSGIEASSRVVTNRLSTAVWYAVAMGRPGAVFGPAPLIEGEDRSALDRLTELWPEIHGEDPSLEATADVAAGELGSAHLRNQGELAALLGWQRQLSSRAFATYWAHGPASKAMAVLGVRQREPSSEEVRATVVQQGPRAVDFLRHPLAHLPRPLPRLDDALEPTDWVRPD